MLWDTISRRFNIGRSQNEAEIIVAAELSRFRRHGYTLINDLLLPSQGNTSFTQIDHTLITPHGIFCIETKGSRGYIFGSTYNPKWTQCTYSGRYQLMNPFRQNYVHTQAIKNLVESKGLTAHTISLVVFPFAAKLNVTNKDAIAGLKDLQTRIMTHRTGVYTIHEQQQITRLLRDANMPGRSALRQHKKEVANLLSAQNTCT